MSLIVPAWMMDPAALAVAMAAPAVATAVDLAVAAVLDLAGPALAAAVIPAPAVALPAELLPETTADPHLLTALGHREQKSVLP